MVLVLLPPSQSVQSPCWYYWWSEITKFRDGDGLKS